MTPTPIDPVVPGKDLVLVFTDMESSSKLWESEGGRFYSRLQAHLDLVQEACRNNNGFSVKSTGDGFFIVFEDSDAAVRFALEAQVNFSLRPDLPGARIGIDAGNVFVVTEPGNYRDYVGPGANRAARICALAAARTVLMSEKVALSIRKLDIDAELESIGSHNLRNIGLETIYRLKHKCLSDERPQTGPPLPVLPWVGDLFVGRQSTLDSILASLRDDKVRCVSIIGLGGMGKTRLSLEAAHRLSAEIPDGIAFAEFDGIRDDDVAWTRLASALRTLGYDGEPKPQDIGAFLARKSILLIMDGVEGLPNSSEFVSELLRRTSQLKLLVSSRKRLKIPSVSLTLDSLQQSDAEKLLRARMLTQDPDLGIEPNSSDISELCRRLDCIPLALELAAARASLMTPNEMLARIETRFNWMTDAEAPESGHRRSLEATIGWSYELLGPAGQRALQYASLFPIGFRLELWERLLGPTSVDDLGELVRSSLIATETRAEQPGKVFYLLETIKLFAIGKLKANHELRHEAVARFSADLLQQAKRGLSLSRTSAEAQAFSALDELAPNLHSAMDHLIELGSNQTAAAVCQVLAALNHYRGRNRQAREIALKGISLLERIEDHDAAIQSGLLRWLAAASLDLGDAPTGAQCAFQILGLARRLSAGERETSEAMAHILAGLAFTASVEPKSAANEFEVALTIARQIGDRSLEGMVRHNMGWLAFCHSEWDSAADHLEAARVLREYQGDLRGIAETSSNLGLLEQERQNLPAAVTLHRRSLDCWLSVLDMEGIGKALFNLAECFELLESVDVAGAYYAASLVIFQRSESQYTDLPLQQLQRLGDSDGIPEDLTALDQNEIIEWLRSRYPADSK